LAMCHSAVAFAAGEKEEYVESSRALSMQVCCSVLCCSVLRYVAVCCSVLQYVAVHCSVLQYLVLQCSE